MALVVETGAGLPNADAYISVADADAYFAARGMTLWADSSFSDTEKEACIRRATDFMLGAYRGAWAGRRRFSAQALDWPRIDVPNPDMIGEYFPNDQVPREVVRACAELAWRAAFGELAEDKTRGVLREKIDTIEVEYDPHSPEGTRFPVVAMLVRPYLNSIASSGQIRLVRA